jgi:hypothetical protein
MKRTIHSSRQTGKRRRAFLATRTDWRFLSKLKKELIV